MNEQSTELQGQLQGLGIWLGIVSELYTSRMNQLLSQHDFTIMQFGVLNHLARNQGEKHTISMITAAHEVNQPGATKIVKKLEGMGLLQTERDQADSRKKYVSITEQGLEKLMQVQIELAPDVSAWFADWDAETRTTFLHHLQILGGWLDTNRLE